MHNILQYLYKQNHLLFFHFKYFSTKSNNNLHLAFRNAYAYKYSMKKIYLFVSDPPHALITYPLNVCIMCVLPGKANVTWYLCSVARLVFGKWREKKPKKWKKIQIFLHLPHPHTHMHVSLLHCYCNAMGFCSFFSSTFCAQIWKMDRSKVCECMFEVCIQRRHTCV